MVKQETALEPTKAPGSVSAIGLYNYNFVLEYMMHIKKKCVDSNYHRVVSVQNYVLN